MRRWLPIALAALLGLTLVPGIADIEALDWREARDMVVGRESTARPEWITPLYAQESFFEKPLLGFAPEIVAGQWLRRLLPGEGTVVDVTASRAVRAVLAAALALLVAVVGTRAFGARAGWLAGCALASTAGLPLAARADGGQLLATLCAWFGIGSMLQLLQARARWPDVTRSVAWLAFGAALLVGGPLPALWPLAGFALYFALARDRAGWREVRPLAGLTIAAGIALPWYGVMLALDGRALLSHLAMFPYAMETRSAWLTAPLVALSYPVLLGFPWSPLLGASLRDAAARLRRQPPGEPRDLRESSHAASLVLALLVAGGTPLVLYPHPPLTAALPALPALALLCGRFLDRVLDGDVDARLLTSATRLTAALGTVGALLIALVGTRLPPAAAGLRLLGTALFATSWLPLLADLLGRRKLAAALFAAPVALCAPVMATRVLPPLEPWLNTREAAESMLAVAPPRAPLVLLEPAPPSLRLLLPRNLVLVRSLARPLAELAGRDGNVYLAFPPDREREAARTAPAPIEILVRTPTLVLARVQVVPSAREWALRR
jgi:4-amino-4-deoxy-L-arabinose transferase-like glycosyltransferase